MTGLLGLQGVAVVETLGEEALCGVSDVTGK